MYKGLLLHLYIQLILHNMALMTLDIHFKFVVLYCVCLCVYVFDCIVCLPLTLKGYN